MMRRWLFLIISLPGLMCAQAFFSAVRAQVTFATPEESRKALQNLAPAEKTRQPKRAERANILPDVFAGWKSVSVRKFGLYNAATMDPTDAPVLLEYQYQQGEQRQYVDGTRNLNVIAVRSKDASGSYGLFTYYRGTDWETSDVAGAQVASRGEQTLVRKEEMVARVSGTRLSPDELSALVNGIAVNGGGVLPTLPRHLPEKGLMPRTTKYVMGAQTLSRLMPGFPAGLIDFGSDPEIEIAEYHTAGESPQKLVLVSYPLPQIAAAKIKAIEKDVLPNVTPKIYARRAGPLLAFVVSAPSQQKADRVLAQVNYSTDVVWDQPPPTNEVPKFGKFLINVFILTGAWLLFAIVAGLLFGTARVLVKKWYPNRVFDRPDENEIIRLNISR